MVECEVYICVDSNGDYATATSADDAREKYEDDIGALADVDGFRVIKLLVEVPLPEVVTLTGKAPAQGVASLAVVS